MIRVLRPVLALVLLGAGTAASATEPVRRTICLTFDGSMSCGDPELEASLRKRMLSPAQAQAAGCTPVTIGRGAMDRPTGLRPADEPTPPPRSLDSAKASRVSRAWDRIERWLGSYASGTLRKLEHPNGELPVWKPLPDELDASLMRHDGGLPLPHGLELHDRWGIAADQESHCNDLVLAGSVDEADPDDGTWHGSLVPFASDSRGTSLFIDPRTGRVGEKRWDENVDYEGSMGWPSYIALLEAIATALESGQPLRDWQPGVSAACELTWSTEPAGPPPATCAGPPRPSPTPQVEPTQPGPTPATDAQLSELGCLPSEDPPVVKSPDKSVRRQVDAVWSRIERWLARKAPKSLQRLNPPAAPRTIARTERAMGLTFPDDYRASLLRHDGARDWGLPTDGLHALVPLKEVRDEWHMMCGMYRDGTTTPDFAFWWHGHSVPFAKAVDGGHQLIDVRTGEVFHFYNETGLTQEAPSYLTFLRRIATSLESGRPMGMWQPKVRDGFLDWSSD
ncbi:SMI1/KNR4 family protein [Nonomuraea sp. NPDC050663]|uniref:SMI1/KNR4 family protein n=1 Tax=Nonomuraea sp. NPDC050663 TaxID=3364370 RepID=UPI00378F1DBD